MPLKALVRKLQETLLTSDFHTKTEVLGAITYLDDQLEDKTKRWIQYTLFEVLNQEGNTPSLQVRLLCHWVLEGQTGAGERAPDTPGGLPLGCEAPGQSRGPREPPAFQPRGKGGRKRWACPDPSPMRAAS